MCILQLGRMPHPRSGSSCCSSAPASRQLQRRSRHPCPAAAGVGRLAWRRLRPRPHLLLSRPTRWYRSARTCATARRRDWLPGCETAAAPAPIPTGYGRRGSLAAAAAGSHRPPLPRSPCWCRHPPPRHPPPSPEPAAAGAAAAAAQLCLVLCHPRLRRGPCLWPPSLSTSEPASAGWSSLRGGTAPP